MDFDWFFRKKASPLQPAEPRRIFDEGLAVREREPEDSVSFLIRIVESHPVQRVDRTEPEPGFFIRAIVRLGRLIFR